MERYYRQQEGAVAQITIENIRQAKQRELLDRRSRDLVVLEQRVTPAGADTDWRSIGQLRLQATLGLKQFLPSDRQQNKREVDE